MTRRVVLDETFDPGRDIRVFLRDGFAKMCAKNPILSHVKRPWPEEGIIDLLVHHQKWTKNVSSCGLCKIVKILASKYNEV